MPVPDQVRDDGSGIRDMRRFLASGFRQNDKPRKNATVYRLILFPHPIVAPPRGARAHHAGRNLPNTVQLR